MTDMNTVVIIGRLTKDTEARYSEDGQSAWGNFTVAVNRNVKNGDKWEGRADFFDVKGSGPNFKSLVPYLKKGKLVGVQGYLTQDRWTDKDGRKCEKVRIFANTIQLLSSEKQQEQKPQEKRPAPQPSLPQNGPESFVDSDFDDLPDF